MRDIFLAVYVATAPKCDLSVFRTSGLLFFENFLLIFC